MGPENRMTYTGHFNLLIPNSVTTEILMIPPDHVLVAKRGYQYRIY